MQSNKRPFGSWLLIVGGLLIFGPFAIAYAFGFFGLETPHSPLLLTWFMGSLTIAGAIATFDAFTAIRQNGWGELGCVILLGSMTCWWAYIFLRSMGLTG